MSLRPLLRSLRAVLGLLCRPSALGYGKISAEVHRRRRHGTRGVGGLVGREPWRGIWGGGFLPGSRVSLPCHLVMTAAVSLLAGQAPQRRSICLCGWLCAPLTPVCRCWWRGRDCPLSTSHTWLLFELLPCSRAGLLTCRSLCDGKEPPGLSEVCARRGVW